MKDFRVARCIDDDGKGISEYAIFSDGSGRKLIETDSRYGKYFCVDNELNVKCKTFERHLFTGRIKDALDTIKNGNGDSIAIKEISDKNKNVVYFLDREVGEELRDKTLYGWKDAKFKYAIMFGGKYFMSGYQPVNRELEIGGTSDILYFDTEDEAEDFMTDIINKCYDIAKDIVSNCKDCKTVDEERDVIFKNLDKMVVYKSGSSIQYYIIDDLIEWVKLQNGASKLGGCECDTPKLTNYGYKIIQEVYKGE